jgi:tRNA (guanine-N7-)-methyltransferase
MSRLRVGKGIAVPPAYAVPEALAADRWAGVFGRRAPLVVEVGFGNGRFLAEMARLRPEADFVGVELYGKGIEKLSRRLERDRIPNVRIVKGEALHVLKALFAPGEIAALYLNFPDPWPKKRHHKRRLVGPALPPVLFSRMAPGADVHLATDHDGYAHQMRDVFEAHPGFANEAGPHRFADDPPAPVKTKYELKFEARGHTIRRLRYRRLGGGG